MDLAILAYVTTLIFGAVFNQKRNTAAIYRETCVFCSGKKQ